MVWIFFFCSVDELRVLSEELVERPLEETMEVAFCC
jgi:hypothetical protein